jgi:predicted PurR-regulated permease PerM
MFKHAPKIIEYSFLVVLVVIALFLLWNLFSPFVGALSVATVVVTICYPLYERIRLRFGQKYDGVAAFCALLLVLLVVFVPIAILGSFILREALSIYSIINSTGSISFVLSFERVLALIQKFVPTFSVDMQSVIQQTAGFIVEHLLGFFAGTASTLFMSFITLFACYYFFKDGKYFAAKVIAFSPLKDVDDTLILNRLARSIRSVILGTVVVAIIQGILTALGLSLIGLDRAILLGCIAAIGALIPGVGTAVVLIPTTIYLFTTGAYIQGAFLTVWGILAVGLVDNILGPYLMSKGNNIHPFLILLSVLGGLMVYGPLGFILGPVIISLFMVLIELMALYVKGR